MQINSHPAQSVPLIPAPANHCACVTLITVKSYWGEEDCLCIGVQLKEAKGKKEIRRKKIVRLGLPEEPAWSCFVKY